MQKKKSIVLSKATRTIKNKEIIEETIKVTGSFQKDVEPLFVKVYLNTVLRLHSVKACYLPVLIELLVRLGYTSTDHNEITIVKHTKQEIAQKLRLSETRIESALVEFTKKDILIRKARSIYAINPTIFARGSWKDIKEVQLSLNFNEDGTSITTEIRGEE